MTPFDPHCPSRQRLRAFDLGNLSGPDSDRVRTHVERCESCRRLLRDLATHSPTHPIHRSGGRLAAHDSPTRQSPASANPDPEAESYSFLLPPERSDEIGRLGNYRVLRLLGKGGMGLVFLAEDLALHRPVALKVMRPELKGGQDGWQRFLREARTMAAIKHEHLVTIYQAGQEGDACYFAMELLEGETLEDALQRGMRPEGREILRLGREIASGLAVLHRSHLVHRDLKPANIWLEAPHARVKILDLGLARSVQEEAGLTRAGMILGTPGFMSPEQARSDPLDGRSDLFTLGCVLYCLCTGTRPFQGGSTLAVLTALAVDTPPPAREVNPQIPEALSDLVARLLAKRPEARPPSAEAVLEELGRIERVLADPAAPSGGSGTRKLSADGPNQKGSPTPRPLLRRRARLTVGIALGAIVACAALGIVAAVLLQPSAPRAEPRPPAAPERVHLSALKPIAREHWPFRPGKGPPGKGPFGKGPFDKGPPGLGPDTEVWVKGKASPHGLFMHPPAPPFVGEPVSFTYHLGKKYRTFQAEVSLNDGPEESESPCTFWVYGDGKVLWKSPRPVTTQADTQKCVVSVEDVEVLQLAVTCPGQPFGAHAVWIEPFLLK
jgi:eukaryotic-like serine/threonine-protein kinase